MLTFTTSGGGAGNVSSPYQDYFEFAFAAADMASMWWQPWLKGVGRSHLELAGMQSRNARAYLQWGRDIAAARSPVDLITANVRLCESVGAHIGDAIPKVSGALSQAAQAPDAFELVALPAGRKRDALNLQSSDEEETDRRRVA